MMLKNDNFPTKCTTAFGEVTFVDTAVDYPVTDVKRDFAVDHPVTIKRLDQLVYFHLHLFGLQV